MDCQCLGTILISFINIYEKVNASREADLNHRPKDHCLSYVQLQSSALPAELSRVACIWRPIC